MLYSCENLGQPILHDTILQLIIYREIKKVTTSRSDAFSNLSFENSEEEDIAEGAISESIQVICDLLSDFFIIITIYQLNGSVVTPLKVSLSKKQYEQLLDTVKWLTSSSWVPELQTTSRIELRSPKILSDISEEEDTGVTTLKMDPQVRAKMFSGVDLNKSQSQSKRELNIKGSLKFASVLK